MNVSTPEAIAYPATENATSRRLAIRLFSLAFLMLFLELALIRWLGTHLVYLSFFSNFVLLGAFLGIGIGFMRAGRTRSLAPAAPFLLAGLVLFVAWFPVEVDRTSEDIIFFGNKDAPEGTLTGLPIYVTLPAVFIAVAAVMAAIGQAVGETFARFRPLEAYRLDIAGSLAGIAAFTLLSFAGAPPIVWAAAVAVLMLVLIVLPEFRTHRSHGPTRLRAALQVALLVLVCAVLLGESLQVRSIWSPYYKIVYGKIFDLKSSPIDIHVNGIPHQQIRASKVRLVFEPFYGAPYELGSDQPLDDVLVVGAGNGTDVALALQNGAKHVDAVEIDPELQKLGERLHPDRPYDDPRVDVHITDGRAFLEQTDSRYDLIVFALPDSLTLVSGQSSLRLESYLFTKEAIDAARERLKPGGMFTMYNFYREPWLVGRLARTLETSFGHPPCVTHREGNNLAVLAIGTSAGQLDCNQTWNAKDLPGPKPATDDYPFLYLAERSIPTLYLATLGLVLLASVLAVAFTGGGVRGMGSYTDLFFMGAAFLLLETKNIVQFALLFGTTWLVNALVFGSILVSVLLAIEVARRWTPRRPALLYVALFASLAVAAAVPQSALLDLGFTARLIAAGGLAFAPIFLANLIFAERFRDTASSTIAFGANLLGAMVGGILEYTALLTGYRWLLAVVAGLYLAAFLTGRRHLRPREQHAGTQPPRANVAHQPSPQEPVGT